jgi:hypothetical protein
MENHSKNPWIGVDLDGTLAKYIDWRGIEHIGDPVPLMFERVKNWLKQGKTVKIFTARASDPKAVPYIKSWLQIHGLPDLEVTNCKDHDMVETWDDRAIPVEHNTGKITDHSQIIENELEGKEF